jgi:dUTPase
MWVRNGDRIAQGELVKQEKYDIIETVNKPELKANRVGGLGSTGVSNVKKSKT